MKLDNETPPFRSFFHYIFRIVRSSLADQLRLIDIRKRVAIFISISCQVF